MQLEIMLFFQRIQNPVLSFLANLFSAFGEESVMILILVAIYWCFDKKKGFAIFSSLFISMLTMQVLKAIIKAPRPFQVHPDLIDADRIETATGYSFPSGHSTGSSAFYFSIALLYNNLWTRLGCILLVIAVPLSRLYLGVHWPADVLCGVIIGLGVSTFLLPVFIRLFDDKKRIRKIYLPLGSAMALISASLAIALHLDKVDVTAFSDLMKLTSVFSTASIGAALELSSSDYVPAKEKKNKILSFVIGIIPIALIQATKTIMPEGIYYIWAFARYALIGLFATYLVPKILIKLDIVKKRSYYIDMFRDVI